ncbi:MAG: AMP-binding protein [Eubacteriales bacterium]|nr:AMP-binding protein [Eubacteriales bacterium]MDY4897640.1 AMP-binding protein [Eubacteriales bacterium]
MKNFKTPNYPLYQTTVFRDFRVMTENVAAKYPDRYAISYKKNPRDTEVVHVTYSEARDFIRNLGTAFIARGLREKQVAIIGESSFEWICTYFALMSIGAVTVPIDKDYPAADIAGIVNRAECTAVCYSNAIHDKIASVKGEMGTVTSYFRLTGDEGEDTSVRELEAEGASLFASGDNSYYDYEIDPDRMASIVFTSGTTGKGKGVMLSTTNIVSDMTQGMYLFDITPKTLNVLPPHHTFGSTVNFVGHFAQGSEIYISSGIKYILNELKEQQPTHLVLVPLFVETFYKRIWAAAEKQGKAEALRKLMKVSNNMRKMGIDMRKTLFKSVTSAFGGKLQMIICGGAALNQDIIDTFDAIGITILNGYGITECAPLITCNRNRYQKSGSVGTPIIGEQVKIKDPDENGEGEICVKGPNVMLGYFRDEEATAAAFDEEGYFRTGDCGRIDEDGWVYITGRIKNLIILSNGKNVYPEEIETELSRIYGINEVVVYEGESRSDSHREVIVAEIYPDYEALEGRGISGDQEIKAYFDTKVREANQNMAPYKAVGLVKIRKTEFIKNTSRKITRFNIDKSID